jgi:hypothetical protein
VSCALGSLRVWLSVGHGDFRLPTELPAAPDRFHISERIGAAAIADDADTVRKRAREPLALGPAQLKLMAEKRVWGSVQPFTDDRPSAFPDGSARRIKQLQVYNGSDAAYSLAKKHKPNVARGTDVLYSAENAAGQGKMLSKMVRWYTPAEVLKMATADNAELLALSDATNPQPLTRRTPDGASSPRRTTALSTARRAIGSCPCGRRPAAPRRWCTMARRHAKYGARRAPPCRLLSTARGRRVRSPITLAPARRGLVQQ